MQYQYTTSTTVPDLPNAGEEAAALAPDLLMARAMGAVHDPRLSQLVPHHQHMLVGESGIDPEVIRERGYQSVADARELVRLGYQLNQWAGQGLLIPGFAPGSDGSEPTHWSYRPDVTVGGRKYVAAKGTGNRLDVPLRCQGQVGDPSVPLLIVEGIKKGDAAASHGACVVVLSGVDNWRGKNAQGGKTALADWEHVALNGRLVWIAYDSDTWRNRHIRRALRRLTSFLESKGAKVEWIVLPDAADGGKVGVDDYLLTHSLDDLVALSVEPALDVRPRIRADNPKMDELVDEAWAAVQVQGAIYRQGTRLVAVDQGPDGEMEVTPLDEYGLVYHLSESADFYKQKPVPVPGGGQQFVDYAVQPPIIAAKVMMSHVPGVPTLRRIVPVPVLDSRGRLIQEPGYDPGTGLWYAPRGRTPAIPDNPTTDQIAAARGLILLALSGFPLDGEASTAHAVALMIEPFVRLLIGGPTPLGLIESPTQGSGKGKLAAVMTRPFLRAPVPWMPAPSREEEWGKVITTAVIEGTLVFAIDNLKIDLVSPALAAALTTSIYKGRILGVSQSVTAPIDWSWIVTANNPVVDNDIARRCIRIRLVPAVEEPWRLSAETFPIPDIDAWVIEHEVPLTEAVLTIIQAWVRAGMPAGTQTLGSYEAWARVLGGILDVAGIPGFLGNLDELYDAANTERAAWRALVKAWWAKYRDQQVSAADLYELVEQNSIDIPINGKDDAGRRRSFGLRLKNQRDRVYEGYQLVSPGTVKGSAKAWKLVPVRRNGEESGETGESASLPSEDGEIHELDGAPQVTPLTPLTPEDPTTCTRFEQVVQPATPEEVAKLRHPVSTEEVSG